MDRREPAEIEAYSRLVDAAYEQVVGAGGSSGCSSMRVEGSEFIGSPPNSLRGYTIVREIHRGGQGVVYEAIQESTRRSVAIKIMNEGPLAGPRGKVRFEREVQLLGQLRHPNIVTIHDSGSSADGFYFVMDYIRGRPLDAFVSAGRLSVRDTLSLFAIICDAVNVAHLRGVIHRDLKPSNIQVDSAGEPHILDFGLAKVAEFDPMIDLRSEVPTMTGQFVGSFPWASPEQVEARHGGMDIRSDVYSLGIVLFQILTGRFPYDVTGNIRDVLESICNAEPTLPSSYRPEINAEVDAMVMRCLCKDKEKRYQGAGDLAREIRRYLAGEPIEAKGDSGWYRLRKAVRRHWVGATLATLILTLVLTSSIALWLKNRQERRLRAVAESARIEAERQEAVANAVFDFLSKDVLQAVDPYNARGEPLSAQQLFERAAEKVADGAFADQPLVEARIRSILGFVFHWQGRPIEAIEQLQTAMDLTRQQPSDENLETIRLARRLATALSAGGRTEDAEPLLRRTVEQSDRLLGSEDHESLLARSALAGCLLDQDRPADAAPLYREVWETRLRVQGADHVATLASLNNHALTQGMLGELDLAAELYEIALEAKRRVHGPDHPETLIGAMNLAHVKSQLGELRSAEPLARLAYDGLARSLGAHHPMTTKSVGLLIVILISTGHDDEAEQLMRESIDSDREAGRSDTELFLGSLLAREGKLSLAEAVLVEAVEWRRRSSGDSHPETLRAMDAYGCLLKDQEKYELAEPLLREAVESADGVWPDGHILAENYRGHWAACLTAMQRYQEAEEVLLLSYQRLQEMPPEKHRFTQARMRSLAKFYEAWGKPDEASAWQTKLAD